MNEAERTTLITEAIKRATEREREGYPIPRQRLWCKEEWEDFPRYSVPVDALALNIDNRRFAAERKLMEEKLGHSLDPENNPNDELSVISILLDTGLHVDGDIVKGASSKDYSALLKDWQKRGQETPFWIRPDGTVHNGNRRLAMLKRIRVEGGIEGTRFVDAIVLDAADINEQELFEMEQREQLTENFKLRYTDINLLLTLRDAAQSQRIDWNNPDDVERVAGELQELVGGDRAYAAIQLRAIKYMDDYLAFIESPGEYQNLIGQIERFRDVGKNMTKMLEDYPDDAVGMLELLFAGINAGIRHGHIRAIGRIFREARDEYRALQAKVSTIEGQETAETKLESPDLEAVAAELASDNEDGNEPAPVVSNYPTDRVKSAILDAIDEFDSKNLEIARKLGQAAGRLRPISAANISEALNGPNGAEIRQYLTEIIGWADRGKTLLQ
jgi:hypothetical protein